MIRMDGKNVQAAAIDVFWQSVCGYLLLRCDYHTATVTRFNTSRLVNRKEPTLHAFVTFLKCSTDNFFVLSFEIQGMFWNVLVNQR